MVELGMIGSKYKLKSLDPKDPYNDLGMEGCLVTIVGVGSSHFLIRMDDGSTRTIQKGAVLEELPPIENEAATMEMMGFSDKEVASYMQNNKIGFIGFSTPPEKINPTTAEKITKVSFSLNDLLLYKNSRYGDTALNPVRIFSKSDADTGLLQRLDDKISRIQNSPEPRKNDVADLMGYLTLLCVSKGWDNFDEFKD